MDLHCPRCKLPLPSEVNFCPSCGRKIKDPSPSVSIGSQIGIYLVSFFIPPFGLWYAYRYLKHGGATEKKIGYVSIVLTVVSIVLSIWITQIFIQAVNQS